MPQEPHEDEQYEPYEKVVHLLSCVGCLDPEQGEETHFVGLRRGPMCIQEALNLEPVDLRLSRRVQVLIPFILLILQPDLFVQEYSLPTQALLCPGILTLRLSVPGPKPPCWQGPQGTDRKLLQGAQSCFQSFLNYVGLGASFLSLTCPGSLQWALFHAHLARLSFCCSEPQESHLRQGSPWDGSLLGAHMLHMETQRVGAPWTRPVGLRATPRCPPFLPGEEQPEAIP